MTSHIFPDPADCGCSEETCVACNGYSETCKVCGGDRQFRTLATECPGTSLTSDQEAAIAAHNRDFRDGRWIDLLPTITVEEAVTLAEGNEPDAEGFALIRLDHLRDDPPLCGLIVVRPDSPLNPPTIIRDATIVADGYDYLVVRHQAREGLVAAQVATAHAINGCLTKFLVKHRCSDIEVREVLGTGKNTFVHVQRIPLTILGLNEWTERNPSGKGAYPTGQGHTNLPVCPHCGATDPEPLDGLDQPAPDKVWETDCRSCCKAVEVTYHGADDFSTVPLFTPRHSAQPATDSAGA